MSLCFSDWLTCIYGWQSGKVHTRSRTQYDSMSKLKFQNQTIAESNRKLLKFKLNSDDQRGILFPAHKDCCMFDTPVLTLTLPGIKGIWLVDLICSFMGPQTCTSIEIYSLWAFFEFLGSNYNDNSSCCHYYFFIVRQKLSHKYPQIVICYAALSLIFLLLFRPFCHHVDYKKAALLCLKMVDAENKIDFYFFLIQTKALFDLRHIGAQRCRC